MKLWPWRGRRAAREHELNREIEWHLNEIREEREAEENEYERNRQKIHHDFHSSPPLASSWLRPE